MKTAYLVSILLMLALPAFGEQKPNFSGTWKLNATESKFPSGNPPVMTRFVEHKGATLHLKIVRDNNGSPSVTEAKTTIGEANPENPVNAVWAGSVLVVTFVSSQQGITQTERWKLDEVGKRTVAETLIQSTDGTERKQLRVFDKQ